MSAEARQPSTFGCAFCPFEDDAQAVKSHLIEQHANSIANQHWATHIYRVEREGEP
jgi:hypothetical protein